MWQKYYSLGILYMWKHGGRNKGSVITIPNQKSCFVHITDQDASAVRNPTTCKGPPSVRRQSILEPSLVPGSDFWSLASAACKVFEGNITVGISTFPAEPNKVFIERLMAGFSVKAWGFWPGLLLLCLMFSQVS